jgi:hypothetical protein
LYTVLDLGAVVADVVGLAWIVVIVGSHEWQEYLKESILAAKEEAFVFGKLCEEEGCSQCAALDL